MDKGKVGIMYIYWLNLFFVIVWAAISKLTGDKYYRIVHWMIFIQMYLLVCLRDLSVGSDTINYIWWFETSKTFPFWDFEYSRHESGYLLFNKVLSFIDNPQLFLAIVGFIPLFIVFRFIQKESRIPWLSVYLFITLGFYADVFNLFRQILALSCIIISYRYLKKNSLWKFALWTLAASLFHISGLAFIAVYFIKDRIPTFKNLYIYLTSAIILYFIAQPLLSVIINIFATRSNILYEAKGGVSLLLVLILILISGLIYRRDVISANEKSVILYNILFFAILMQVLALEFSLFTRVTTYFMFFLVIFIPEILSSIKDKASRTVGIFLIVLLTAIQYYLALGRDSSGIVPFSFFF